MSPCQAQSLHPKKVFTCSTPQTQTVSAYIHCDCIKILLPKSICRANENIKDLLINDLYK